jgi:extracellular factor (EF) 3-hydroxypalmitic acid methyl ester biosynthesis protein
MLTEVQSQLDQIVVNFQSSPENAHNHFAYAVKYLNTIRGTAGELWKSLVDDHISLHPLTAQVRLCPLTARCANKPRGYAGDAVMIDYIYGSSEPDRAVLDPVTRAMFGHVVSSPACRAVRYRRYRLANLIDAMAIVRQSEDLKSFRVLSVASGHGRELALSTAFQQGMVSEFVALDQDKESLSELIRSYGDSRSKVIPVEKSIKALLKGGHDLGKFDLIYSAGLYDYLETPVAKRLTAELFGLLNPGGKLLYANFAPDIHDVGYMEAAMDWWLIYRDAAQTLDLACEIQQAEIKAVKQYTDPDENIHFVEISR